MAQDQDFDFQPLLRFEEAASMRRNKIPIAIIQQSCSDSWQAASHWMGFSEPTRGRDNV